MRILVVEDDGKIADFISNGLLESGYQVESSNDGQEALVLVLNGEFDLVILDLMLPKVDGFEVLKRVRGAGLKTPILVLSAKRSVDDRVKGLQTGSDDYLTKPFSFSELLARVQALLRRIQPAESDEYTKFSIGGISIDRLNRSVEREGQPIELQPKEFVLLDFFMRNPGRVLSKTQILERIWNFQFDPQTNVVDVLVFRLRSKIDRHFDKKVIQTIRGAGYVFKPH